MEYKRDERDGGFRIVEPTVGRTDGQVEISALCGINLCHVGYCDAAGQPRPPLKLDPTHVWRDEFRDFISARILGTNCFYPPSHRIDNAYWRWDDPGPALLESSKGCEKGTAPSNRADPQDKAISASARSDLSGLNNKMPSLLDTSESGALSGGGLQNNSKQPLLIEAPYVWSERLSLADYRLLIRVDLRERMETKIQINVIYYNCATRP